MTSAPDAHLPESVLAIVRWLEQPADAGAPLDQAASLAADVELLSPFGPAMGTEGVVEALSGSRLRGLLAHANWSFPASGDEVTATATAPATSPVGGVRFTFRLGGDGRVRHLEVDLLPAHPVTSAPVVLSEELKALITGALANGTPIIVAYVGPHGEPRLSYRGTVQPFGSDGLALWARDRDGGLVRALGENDHLSFFYGDRARGVTLQLTGRARVETDVAICEAVYSGSPEPERNLDWRRAGVAVIVELDRVDGRTAAGPILLERGANP
jgi:hypothetical protein